MTPRVSLLRLVALGCLPFAMGVWIPELIHVGLLLNLTLVVVAGLDILLTPPTSIVSIERETADVLSVGAENPVTLRVRNRSSRTLTIELHDEAPEPSNAVGLPLEIEVPPGAERSARYRVTPRRRGQNAFRAIHIRYVSRLRFWSFIERRPSELPVRVFPDIRSVARFELLATRNRLEEVGLKLWRIRGQGGEFERLREYHREDDVRSIDWRATSKHSRLITREFSVERNQNVIVLLDCGRSMRNETDGISHLDFGLNAGIMLSYIALGQGDNVSLLAVSNRLERHVGPVRGRAAIRTIIRETYDLEPRFEATDYGLACEELLRRQRKRALVLLITQSLDEEHLDAMRPYLRTITAPHVLVCVLLRDRALTDLADRVPVGDVEAFHVGAAAEHLNAQARKIAKLRESGALVLDVLPGELSSALINQYLELKARHLL